MISGRTVLALLVFCLLAAGAYLGARHWPPAVPAYSRLQSPDDCDLRTGPCRRPVAGGTLSLAISPEDIPLMQPLRLSVRAEGLQPVAIAVDIRGQDMDMGRNRTRLTRTGDGTWVGETILPICSRREMRWEAAVQLDGAQAVEVPFGFSTVRR